MVAVVDVVVGVVVEASFHLIVVVAVVGTVAVGDVVAGAVDDVVSVVGM